MPLHYKLAFRRTKIVFCKKGPMYFYQFSTFFLKKVHHNFLFQENQVPVNNLMLLRLRRKMYARTFWDLFWLVQIMCLFLNGHLVCAAESCCTWLYFDLMIFIDLIETFFAKRWHARSTVANGFYLFVQNWNLYVQTSMIHNGIKKLSEWAFISVVYVLTLGCRLV